MGLGEAFGDFFTNIKDAFGNFISDDEVKNILNQVKSTFEENVTKENLSIWVDKIKTGVKDITDQEEIKKIFEYAKKQVGHTTGQAGKVIQCLEKDINDTSCLERFTESAAISIQVRSILLYLHIHFQVYIYMFSIMIY